MSILWAFGVEARCRDKMEVSHNVDRKGFCTHCGADIAPGKPVIIVKSCFRLKGEHWFCAECFKLALTRMNVLFTDHFDEDDSW